MARPKSLDDVQECIAPRLRHLEYDVWSVEEDKHDVILMGGPLQVL
jgi:hypothetical protein